MIKINVNVFGIIIINKKKLTKIKNYTEDLCVGIDLYLADRMSNPRHLLFTCSELHSVSNIK